MIINGIECPKELYDSIKNGNVVVFVGAGASMGEPTSLPSFHKLAADVGEVTGEGFKDVLEVPETFLGRLQDSKYNVKNIVTRLLKSYNPVPNSIHESILDLFQNTEMIRIVTTNYDNMLESAFEKKNAGKIIKVFNAPALPFGNDFSGIVHIHGNQEEPKRIVITDSDFGFAYMLEGYTTRFLSKLFEGYTVLFIGYSYKDTVMKYLTRALPDMQKGRRYILTDDDNKSYWDLLGILPLVYPSKDYETLAHFIRNLGERVCRGLISWQVRCVELASYKPPIDNETTGEILQILENPSLTKIFFNNLGRADFGEWVNWLDQKGVLVFTYNNEEADKRDDTDSVTHIADWLIEHSIISNFYELFELISNHNNQLSKYMVRKLLYSLDVKSDWTSDLAYSQIIVFLKDTIKEVDFHSQFRIIKECYDRNLFYLAWDIFKIHFAPKFTLTKNLFDLGNKGFEGKYEYVNGSYEIRDLWSNYFKHNISLFALDAINSMITIYEMNSSHLTLFNQHEEKEYEFFFHDFEDKVKCNSRYEMKYDFFRIFIDCLNEISMRNKSNYLALINYLFKTKSVGLRKSAIISLKDNTRISATKKVNLLVKNFNIFDYKYKTEIYRLVGENINEVDSKTQNEILKSIIEKSKTGELDDTKSQTYEVYNWLVWLSRKVINNCEYKAKIENHRGLFTEFSPREFPELNSYMSSFHWEGDVSPIDNKRISELSITEILDFIDSYVEKISFGEQSETRIALFETIAKYGTEHIEWTLIMMAELLERSNYDEDIWSSLLKGVTRSNIAFSELEKLLVIINNSTLIKNNSYDVSELLESLVLNENLKDYIHKLEGEMFEIINQICKHPKYNISDDSSAVTFALNSTIHGVAITILSLINLHKLKDGIPKNYKDLIIRLFENDTDSAYYKCMFTGYYRILYNLDDQWTITNIFPLLNSHSTEAFTSTWEGLLTFSPIIYERVASLMHEYYLSALKRISEFNSNLQFSFVDSLAVLLVFSVSNPIVEFIPSLFKEVSNEVIEAFLSKLKWILKQMNDKERETIWNRWILTFFMNAGHNIPRNFTDIEIESMFSLLVYCCESSIESAVESLINFKPTKFKNFYDFDTFIDNKIFDNDSVRYCVLRYILSCDLHQVYDKSVLQKLFKLTKFENENQKNQILELSIVQQLFFDC